MESNKSIKWCPIPGCGRAVRLPEAEQTGNKNLNKPLPVTSHAVDCGNAHFFCWECLGKFLIIAFDKFECCKFSSIVEGVFKYILLMKLVALHLVVYMYRSKPRKHRKHFFLSLGEAHAPSGCKQWQEWQIKIAEVKPEELKASCSGTEDAANCLWLVTNSKPCPNCKSPIQKNEGCNHMKCSKVNHQFIKITHPRPCRQHLSKREMLIFTL